MFAHDPMVQPPQRLHLMLASVIHEYLYIMKFMNKFQEARSEDHFALELAKLIHGMAAMSAARGGKSLMNASNMWPIRRQGSLYSRIDILSMP